MSNSHSASDEDKRIRNKSVIALAGLIAVAAINLVWLWGVVFAVWALSGMILGRAYLVTELSHKKFPALCWCINIVWLAIGLSMIASLGLPNFVNP